MNPTRFGASLYVAGPHRTVKQVVADIKAVNQAVGQPPVVTDLLCQRSNGWQEPGWWSVS